MAKDKKMEQKKKAVQYTSAKETVKKTEESGGGGATSFKLPEGVKRFKFAEAKTYRLNIVPYIVGKNNPHADEGFVHYERTFETHRDVGAEANTYVCLKQFGKRCPICETFARLQRQGVAFENIKDLRPKTRQLYLVQDLDDAESGIQVLETGYFKSFGELLASKIKAGDEEDNFENFFHLDGGQVLKILVAKDSFTPPGSKGSVDFFKASNIEMRPRKNPLPESILDEAPCLDDMLIELEYEELKKLFEEGAADADDDSDEDETPAVKPKDKKKAASPVDEDEEEEEAPAPTKKKGKKEEEDEADDTETEAEDEADEFDFEEDEEEAEEEAEEEESEDEGESEEEDAEEEEEVEDVTYAKDDKVEFKHNKKKVQGVVTVANNKSGVALVKVAGEVKPVSVKYADLTKLEDEEAEDEADEFDFEDEEEEEPAPKPKGKTPPVKAKAGKK